MANQPIQIEEMFRSSSRIQIQEFTIKEYSDMIKKSIVLGGEDNMGIESISLRSIPDHLHCIILSFGNDRPYFVWKRDELSSYLNRNMLEKYQMKDLIPTFKYAYHQIKLNFIYDSEEVFKNCEYETREIIHKVAMEDETKEVEYWDMDDQCACQAYGVKYEEVKIEKKVMKNPVVLQTPQFKIIYKGQKYDKNTMYQVPFYDEVLKNTNYIKVQNQMYGLTYFG
jgi:hypothetical protein